MKRDAALLERARARRDELGEDHLRLQPEAPGPRRDREPRARGHIRRTHDDAAVALLILEAPASWTSPTWFREAEGVRLIEGYRQSPTEDERNMQTKLIEQIVSAVALEVRASMLRQAEFFQAQISTLQAELGALRAEKARYRGGWREGQTYARGDLVTHSGLWHANAATSSKPSGGETNWTFVR